jgi:hypothetical protein
MHVASACRSQAIWFGYELMRFAGIQDMHRWVDNHRRGLW